MDILIKGERVELPKISESYIDIRIYETGEIVIDGDQDKTAKAIALPEHGRLIIADALLEKLERIVTPDDLTYTIARGILKQIVEDAQTIVEATE